MITPQWPEADKDKVCVACEHKVQDHTIEGWCMCVSGDAVKCSCPGLMFDVYITPKKEST